MNFNRGRRSLEYKGREGRPKTVVVIMQDRTHPFRKIRNTNRRRRIIVHHDNASSHTSAQTSAFFNVKNVELMDHPPYSPDLAPNDFFLFPYIKKKMRSQ